MLRLSKITLQRPLHMIFPFSFDTFTLLYKTFLPSFENQPQNVPRSCHPFTQPFVPFLCRTRSYRDQVVEVWVGGRPELERLEVDVVERLVVEAERHVARLHQLVQGQHSVVRLHNHLGDLLAIALLRPVATR